MEIPILYQDTDLMVINKPAGLVVNRAESVKAETVQDWAERRLKISASPARLPAGRAGRQTEKLKVKDEDLDFYNRAGIVHRLDKETSGILIIAKTPQAFDQLQRQFRERQVKKTYLALVHGQLVPGEGEIRAPVGRLPWNRQRFGVLPGGREAVTKYKVISAKLKVKSENFSLVELYPQTGRTHQIRVHLKYVGHPIVGDYLYAGRKVSRRDRTWAPRVMLHAWKLECLHPSAEQRACLPAGRLALEAPIPDDMDRIINSKPETKSQAAGE